MARDLMPGRMGLSTAIRLGMAKIMAMIFTTTIARKEEGSSFSSMTMKTMPAEASPSVRSKTHRKTVECLRDTQPQQHDVATLKQFRNFGSGAKREEMKSLLISGAKFGTTSAGVNS